MQRRDPVECLRQRRLESLQRLPIRVDPPGEDTGVPEVAAVGQHLLRLGRRRLFDEALDERGRLRRVQRGADPDVSVAGRGGTGDDPEADEVAALGSAGRLLERFDETAFI